MDHLLACARAFEHLLDIKYHIILGRKGKLTELNLIFSPSEFHHLIGIHKLLDLHLAKGNREKIFRQILSAKISITDIQKSHYFSQLQKRIELFDQIENILDSNQLVFRYNKSLRYFSMIEATYLLSTPYQNTDIYIFLDNKEENFFCRSFFPKEDTDYTRGQPIYTLLKKEKINLSNGNVITQFNRLT